MDRLANLTLRDVAVVVGRYRPVAVTVALLLVMLAVLPGPRFGRPDLAAGVQGATFRGRQPAPATQTTTPAATPGAPDASLSTPTTSSAGAPFSAPTSGSNSFSSPAAGAGAPTFSGDSDAAAPDTAFEPTDPQAVGVSTSTSDQLAIVINGWGTATAGTPLAAQQVPAESLPVGKRIGQDDKRSYVRLAGDSTTLVLKEKAEGARTTTGTVGILACRITVADWKPGGSKPFNEVPHDAAQCVAGVRDNSGSWSFPLSAYADRTDNKGFALVPAPGSSVDFQVNFAAS